MAKLNDSAQTFKPLNDWICGKFGSKNDVCQCSDSIPTSLQTNRRGLVALCIAFRGVIAIWVLQDANYMYIHSCKGLVVRKTAVISLKIVRFRFCKKFYKAEKPLVVTICSHCSHIGDATVDSKVPDLALLSIEWIHLNISFWRFMTYCIKVRHPQ